MNNMNHFPHQAVEHHPACSVSQSTGDAAAMSSLVKINEKPLPLEPGMGLVVYECLPTETFGIRDDGSLVSGMVLKPLFINGYDVLNEQMIELGSDAQVHMPDGGLKVGSLYEPVVINVSAADFELGIIDDWDVLLVEVTDTRQITRYRQMAREPLEHQESLHSTASQGRHTLSQQPS